MPDQRSVMKEYRYLDEKRVAQGLTPEEQARFHRLKDLVGPEVGAGGLKPGFDVHAAAAQLRESLLPAGLRNRPPPTPVPAPEPELEEPEPTEVHERVFDQAPFSPLGEGAALEPQEALFDPSSLGTEQPAYDPNAAYAEDAAYDPDAQPYDPNAAYPTDAAAYDPNAPPYDPNAAYPADPNAAYPADPNAYDPNAAFAADPNAYPGDQAAYDPNALPYDPNRPWDPDATQPEGIDPNAYPADPNAAYPADAAAYDPSAQPFDPNAPWDPNAPQPEAIDAGVSPYDPNAPWEPGAPIEAAMPEGGSFIPGGEALPPVGWDAEPPLPEATAEAAFGEYDAAGGGTPLGEDAELGSEPPLSPEALFAEPAAPGALPEFGEYDDAAGFGAAPLDVAAAAEAALAGDFQAASGGSFGAGADAAAPEWAQAAEPPPWQDAPPLDLGAPIDAGPADTAAGFEVAPTLEPEAFAPALDFSRPDFSSGPPDGEAELAEPTFSEPAPFPLDGATEALAEPPFEAPPLDLSFDAPAAPDPEPVLEQPEPIAAEPLEAAPVEAERPPAEEEEIPTVDGADILEEIVEDAPVAPPQSLDFEPLVPPAAIAVAAPPVAAAPVAPRAPIVAAAPPAPPPAAVIAPPAPAPDGDPDYHVAGSHRVVVHTIEGLVKRGVLEDADLDGPFLALSPQPGGASESLATEKVKAIFFMLSPGEKPPPAEGKKVRVTFRDGRQVAGFSPDYRESGVGFFMVPGDTRTNTGRIWVFRSAVRQVAVS